MNRKADIIKGINSWKENKYGMKYVEIDKKLDICFIGDTHGSPWIDLEVKEE